MIFFFAEDGYYYSDQGISELKEKYSLQEIVIFPSIEDVRDTVRSHKSDMAFIAPYLPSSLDKTFEKTGFFENIDLPNREGILTTGQKKLQIPEEVALKEKLGIDIHRPTVTLKDYGGAELLTREAMGAVIKERYGYPIKGFMLTGIPGTGKSFFAKCFAGETNRLLVELNLSQLMEQPNTIHSLNMIFHYFIHHPGRYILWIDEIEKMMVGEKAIQVLGVLLTRINDLNSHGNSSLFILATANNISEIAKRNPEFLRNGRFDLLLFILPPVEADAEKIFDMYASKAYRQFIDEKVKMLAKNALSGDLEVEGTRARLIQEDIITLFGEVKDKEENCISGSSWDIEVAEHINKHYAFSFDSKEFVMQAMVEYRSHATTERFIYVPAEIEYIIQDVSFSFYFQPKFMHDSASREKAYKFFAKKYKPLQVSLKSSIDAMKGASASFISI